MKTAKDYLEEAHAVVTVAEHDHAAYAFLTGYRLNLSTFAFLEPRDQLVEDARLALIASLSSPLDRDLRGYAIEAEQDLLDFDRDRKDSK